MTSPISSDKTLSPLEQKARPVKREAATGPAAATQTTGVETARNHPAPDVGRAARLFAASQQATGTESQSGIQDQTQARSLVDRLRAQFNQDPAVATRAMGRTDMGQATLLLSGAPA